MYHSHLFFIIEYNVFYYDIIQKNYNVIIKRYNKTL